MAFATSSKMFQLFNKTVVFSPGQQNIFIVHNIFMQEARDTAKEYKAIYEKYGKLEVFCQDGYEDGLKLITGMANMAVQMLLQDGYYNIDLEGFIAKYYAPYLNAWDNACAEVMEQYVDLLENKEQARNARELRKQSRMRFEAGGYGSTVGGTVTGLAKGMAISGVGNISTGAAHSVANFIGNLKTSSQINSKMKAIYHNTKTYAKLEYALFSSLLGVAYAYIAFLQNNSNLEFETISSEESREVNTILKNIVSLNIEDEEFKTIVVELIEKDPFNAETYYAICKRMPEQYNNVNQITDFVGISAEVFYIRRETFLNAISDIVANTKEGKYNTLIEPLEEISHVGQSEFATDISIIQAQEFLVNEYWNHIPPDDMSRLLIERKNITGIANRYKLFSKLEFLDAPINALIDETAEKFLSATNFDLTRSFSMSKDYFAENMPNDRAFQTSFLRVLLSKWSATDVSASIESVVQKKVEINNLAESFKNYQIDTVDISNKLIEQENQLVMNFIDQSKSIRNNGYYISQVDENVKQINAWRVLKLEKENQTKLRDEMNALEETISNMKQEAEERKENFLQNNMDYYVKVPQKGMWISAGCMLLFVILTVEFIYSSLTDFVAVKSEIDMYITSWILLAIPSLLKFIPYYRAIKIYSILIEDKSHSFEYLASKYPRMTEKKAKKTVEKYIKKGYFVNMIVYNGEYVKFY